MKSFGLLNFLICGLFFFPTAGFTGVDDVTNAKGNSQQHNSIAKIDELPKENNELRAELPLVKSEAENLKKDKLANVDLEKLHEVIAEFEKSMNQKISSENVLIEKKLFEQMLDVSEKNIAAPLFIVTTFGVFLTILIVVGTYFFKQLKNNTENKYDELHKEIKKAHAESRKDHENQEKKIAHSLARTYNINSVTLCENNQQAAVKEGEKALEYALIAYDENTTVIEEMYYLANIKSNLAYYYAAYNETSKSARALEYVEYGLKAGERNQNYDMIDNFLYVCMKFGKTKNLNDKWKEVYTRHNKMEGYTKLHTAERQEYEDHYEKIS